MSRFGIASAGTGIVALIGLAMWCFGPLLTHSQIRGRDPTAVVRSLDEALNAHNSNAVIGMLAEVAAVQEDRAPQTRGQIQGWVEELIREDVRIELIDEPWVAPDVSSGDERAVTVTWHARLDMQPYRALGLQFVPATIRAVVVNDRVAFLSIRPDPSWRASLGWTALI